jgi:hypothetical protein
MGGDFFSDPGLAGTAPSVLPALRVGLCCFFMVKLAHQVFASLNSAALSCKKRRTNPC